MMTRAPENIPADPTPATARPMMRATEVGAAPHYSGVSTALLRHEAWVNEIGLKSRRSRGVLQDYALQLKIWYKMGKNKSEMCVRQLDCCLVHRLKMLKWE